jgi:hypothetical protein
MFELVTLAFAVVSFAMMVVWWHKPVEGTKPEARANRMASAGTDSSVRWNTLRISTYGRVTAGMAAKGRRVVHL